MRFLLISVLCLTYAFALTPFSLENIKTVNVTVLHKGKLVDEAMQETIKKDLEKRLNALGIKTESKRFANFLLKIKVLKVDKLTVGHVTLLLSEDATLHREVPTEGVAIGFQKDDLFQIDSLESDLKDSIDYLFEEFADQYKIENSL